MSARPRGCAGRRCSALCASQARGCLCQRAKWLPIASYLLPICSSASAAASDSPSSRAGCFFIPCHNPVYLIFLFLCVTNRWLSLSESPNCSLVIVLFWWFFFPPPRFKAVTSHATVGFSADFGRGAKDGMLAEFQSAEQGGESHGISRAAQAGGSTSGSAKAGAAAGTRNVCCLLGPSL